MKWQAVAKSVIGTKHIKSETPCQDYSDYKILDKESVIIGAVSDGMGSAKFSQIGSQLAVETTLTYLQKEAIWKYKIDENAWKEHFKKLLIEIRTKLGIHAKDNELNIHDLACTLIAFVATPKLLVAMQIGDGLIVVGSNNEDYELLFQPDKGEFANETTPVTSSTAIHEMRFCLKSKAYDFICAATDGVEHLALDKKTQRWKPYNKFFNGLEESIFSINTLQHKEREVDDFLNNENLNKRTDDDKTLLLCAYGGFVEERRLYDGGIKPSPEEIPNLNDLDVIQPSPHPKDTDEKLKQFIDFIKAEITSIPEAQGITPIVNFSKGSLEVVFKSPRRIQYFDELVSKIRERKIITSQNFITVKDFTVYGENSDDSSLYARVKITIPNINAFRIVCISVGTLTFFAIVFGIITFTQSNSKTPKPSDVKTPSSLTTPSTSSPEKTPSPKPTPTQSSPALERGRTPPETPKARSRETR
ncbi:PP2C family serine/threonine-protein phosphatase [Anabaena sp. UHCC 0451]|uniref:PP2C family serine/threonine-protein phosphatase n=1 Tax=Anabaena sp. UHCC 0451 TaxID=2055235 RepID=UPI002B1F26F8|nr:PP2C family serine/threonine-protein phosphatase [Anabaena sp. UHCC 0451]MEA5576232.1 PP2C family serine/threonine-protein phosphatase [Anabaena sp. UHCC 0451]